MSKERDAKVSPDQLWAAMRRDFEGMRQLRDYLHGIKHLDDAAFAETTSGADRAEMSELLDRLNDLLAELDNLTAQIHPAAN